MFSQISRIPDLIRKFWAKKCGLYAGVFGTCHTEPRAQWMIMIIVIVLLIIIIIIIIIITKFNNNKYGLLTKCEVKMAGYWPSSFFACLWTKTKLRSINLQYPAILTEQTWPIKDLSYGFWWNFACEIQRVVPSGQDGSILPTWVANHSARFGSSCLLAELVVQ